MLRFIDQLIRQPIVSIRTGQPVTYTDEPIINPNKLRVEAFYCEEDRVNQADQVVFASDIREIGELGLIVDSEEAVMPLADLVRLEEFIEIDFQMIGKRIVTESGKKLGKVENYVVDDSNFRIEKIYAKPRSYQALSTNDFIISRRQIAGVNDKQVVVKDAVIKDKGRSHRPSFNPLGS